MVKEWGKMEKEWRKKKFLKKEKKKSKENKSEGGAGRIWIKCNDGLN